MSPNREDYIQAIFKLYEERGFASNKDVADMLNVSRPSVSEMTRKLREDGLVRIERTRIIVTKKGAEAAKDVLSRQRIWEQFLHEYLNMDVEEVGRHANLLKHATNDTLRDALNKLLGYPQMAPDGTEIYLNKER